MTQTPLKIFKKNACILAFDDGIQKDKDSNFYKTVPLVGVTFKGIQLLHVAQSTIELDGLNSTEKIIEQMKNNPHLNEIQIIFVDSPTLGGFNIVDYELLYSTFNIPILLIPESRPKLEMYKTYEKVFPERKEQIQWLKNLPSLEFHNISINIVPEQQKIIYFHMIGTTKREVIPLLNNLTHYSSIPEPLRVAHMIASHQKFA